MSSTRHRLLLNVIAIAALYMSLSLSNVAQASASNASPVSMDQVQPCNPPVCYGDLFYGTNQSWMSTAISKAGWPQKVNNWCGIANIAAINWYDQIKTFGLNVIPTYPNQNSIDGLLRSPSAVSPWGLASGNPAFTADIAGDGGTDPRAIAYGLYTVTPNNFYFHNWIYNTNNLTATYDFASDFGPAHGLNDPISVTINIGEHSFVIDGVYATGDPSAGGNVVDAIDTWDPAVGSGFGQYNTTMQQLWSTNDWDNYQFPHGSVLWKYPYNTNNGYDPEPSTNPGYYNAPTQFNALHWNTYWVTIEQDTVTRCNGSPDIAYDQDGNEVPHNGAAYCP